MEPPSDPEGDPVRLARIAERQQVTGKLTETTRYVGLGLPALYYGIISSDTPFALALVQYFPRALAAVAILGILTIVFDHLQFLMARASVIRALARTDAPNLHNDAWLVYRARQWFFLIKQMTAAIGCAILVFIIANAPKP